MDFRLYCQNRESSSRIFSIPNPGMGGCDLIPPIQTRFSVRRMSTGGGTFVFLPLEVFCVFFLSAAGKARMGMPVDCLRNCHTNSFRMLFLMAWQFRVSQGIPSSNVLDAAVRKTRKAVQEEKHVPSMALQNS